MIDARSVLVVDDDDAYRARLVKAFEARGWEARGARSAAEAAEMARSESPEHAVVDLRMPGGSGIDLVRALVEIDPATRVVVLTGYGSIATAIDAIRAGAVHYLTKPADVDQIIAAWDGNVESKDEGAVPSLARVEWEHIHRVLGDCGGNVSQAARLLGIHRRSLQRKLAKFPVRR